MSAVLSPLASAFNALWPARQPAPRSKSARSKSGSRTRVVPAESDSSPEPEPSKRVAIVGAGTGGIGVLLAILDLPPSARKGWQIDVFEAQDEIGGVWLPHPSPPSPPELPKTPLYPALHTNTPVPTMTFPNFPFPPDTALFPPHDRVLQYLKDSVTHFSLASYIHLSHSIESAEYSTEDEEWTVELSVKGERRTRKYDHVISAVGRYHTPSIPVWQGQDEWIAGAEAGEREVLHSLWYRGAEKYSGRTVVVVGFGASGWDLAAQCVPVAKETYHSFEEHPDAPFKLPPVEGTILKPKISHFTSSAIHFNDGTSIPATSVTILLGTGFSLLAPWLKNLNVGPHDPKDPTLTTNENYIRPLHHEIFALDPKLPLTALAFVGLSWFVAVAQNSYAQGTFIAHGLANTEGFFPSREEMLVELEQREDEARAQGSDPFKAGHKFLGPGDAEAYQDNLISLVRQRSAFPLPSFLADASQPYVPEWRRWGRAKGLIMRRGWRRAVDLGVEGQFAIEGEGTEEEWIECMRRVLEWEERQNEEVPTI